MRSILRNPWVWATLAGMLLVTLMRPAFRRVPAPPPVLGEAPTFDLLDERGESFGSSHLLGTPWVASFFSTTCPTTCPTVAAATAALVERYRHEGAPVRVVTFTVEPEREPPEVLKAFAARRSAAPESWTLVTGPAEATCAVQRALLATCELGGTLDCDEMSDVAHAGRLVLIDGSGGLRGCYRSDSAGLDEVFHRSLHVLAEGGVAPRRRGMR